jgi:ABC-type dipeptide/oligopeptide/nickel transport system ATPase component
MVRRRLQGQECVDAGRLLTTALRGDGEQVLLLDEITVDLDVLGRADLLDYLKKVRPQWNRMMLMNLAVNDESCVQWPACATV